MDTERLNRGLQLAMEWGKDWLKPIRRRLAAVYPDLAPAELRSYDATCGAAMRRGFALLPVVLDRLGGDPAEIDPVELQRVWSAELLREFPWIDEANRGALFSQSVYYSRK